jgi:hypothetical protein
MSSWNENNCKYEIDRLKLGNWLNPHMGDSLVDDKGKVCTVRQVREEGLVMRLAYYKPNWTQSIGVWVRRSSLDKIDWKPILYGNCTSMDSLRMKQKPILKNLQKLVAVQKESDKCQLRFKPKRMIQI